MALVLPKPKEKYWITYIKQRIKKNKNFLGFISGQTGSGKSWCSISIGEQVDPDFNVDRIVFGGLELMNLINSGKLRKGSCVVFEEAGVEMSHKNWQSVVNKMLNYLLQTFRHRNFILIMNSPFLDFLDASTRKLFHAEMRTLGINYKKKLCKLKPQLLQYNSRLKKFYYKRLKVIKPQGKVPVDVWNIPKPSKDLIEQYEKKKLEYTNRLNKKIYQELDSIDVKDKKRAELTDIQKDTLDMLKQGLKVDQIAVTRGRAKAVVRETMRLIKKKGYKIIPIYEKGKLIRYNIEERVEI